MSSLETAVATQKRLGSYSGGKASYGTIGGNLFGQLMPLDPSMMLQSQGIIGQAFQFMTQGANDIKANDILTIESTDYTVKGVARKRNGSVDVLECLLVLRTAP